MEGESMGKEGRRGEGMREKMERREKRVSENKDSCSEEEERKDEVEEGSQILKYL